MLPIKLSSNLNLWHYEDLHGCACDVEGLQDESAGLWR